MEPPEYDRLGKHGVEPLGRDRVLVNQDPGPDFSNVHETPTGCPPDQVISSVVLPEGELEPTVVIATEGI